MSEISPTQMPSLRPVTPLGIIASNLERLERRAAALSYGDSDFARLLAETARVANGLEAYLIECSSPVSPILADLAADTTLHDWSGLHASGITAVALESEMLSGHVEGRLLNILVHAMRAKRVLEIGVFTGYSALAMAEALPDDGTLVACEIDAYASGVAREWFDRSPHGRKIRIDIGPALQTLQRLRDSGESFDFIFIDADKSRYAAYFDAIVGSALLATNGLICVDNTLLQGEPYRAGPRSSNGTAISAFNRIVADDARVEQVLLPIRDGVTLIRRA